MTNVDNFLAHYGVKGMRWGVVRSDDQLSRSGAAKQTSSGKSGGSSAKPKSSRTSGELSNEDLSKIMDEFYSDKSDKQLQAEGKRKLAEQASEKFPHKKGDDHPLDTNASDLESGGLTRNQKIALGVGAAAAVGVLGYYAHQKMGKTELIPGTLGKLGKSDDGKRDREETGRQLGAEWESIIGTKVTPSTAQVAGFKGSFYPGLRNQAAMNRPEFTIPKTMTFQRLSNYPETGEGYDKGTYATFLTNDKKMYGQSGEFGSSKYTLSFQPTEDVRVPSLKTVLGELKTTMQAGGESVTDKQVFAAYHGMSGGMWRGNDLGQGLIKGLKAKGYTALVDDMDAGYMGDLPLVFFGETKQVSATPRSIDDKLKDRKSAVPLLAQYV